MSHSHKVAFLALSIILLVATSCRKEDAPVSTVPTSEQIEHQAQKVLFRVQASFAREDAVHAAELKLARKKTAGEVQLATLALQEAKAAADKVREEAKAELDALHAMETQSGEQIYSGKIEAYDNYAKRLQNRVHLDEKHSVPDSSRTRYVWEGIKSASLGVVVRSDFSPEAPSKP